MTTADNQNPGCLASLLSLLKLPNNSAQAFAPYRVNESILTAAEFAFYDVLHSVVGSHLTILAKVRLSDIFHVANTSRPASYLSRISQEHVDFLLCTPNTMQPVAAIELDDAGHQQARRRKRDEFVDGVFKAAGLPLLHVPVKRVYSLHDIAVLLAPVFTAGADGESSPRAGAAGQPAAPAPRCPKCGVPMILRTAHKGKRQGQQFYVCPNFAKCRQAIPASKIGQYVKSS